MQSPPRIDLIWSLTLVCPWDCAMCSVDAVHVRRRQGNTELRSEALSQIDQLSDQSSDSSIYVQAANWRQARGLELDLAGKLRVLDHLEGFDPKIDISGGDPMVLPENVHVMETACSRFGRDNVTLTATGAGLINWEPSLIGPLIGELNFTYDSVGSGDPEFRPLHYAKGNLRRASEFARLGVKVRAECPLTSANCDPGELTRLYGDLHENGIGTLLLMRMFPVGRGSFRSAEVPSRAQYITAISTLRELETRYRQPKLRLQCALRHLSGSRGEINPCDLVRESFGLLTDGTLLASPWALDGHGKPLDEAWVLGSLATTPLREILASPKVQEYRHHLNDNFGHCKIFAYLNSDRNDATSRMFDESDPLYDDT
jgi:MoaA/NifB/PqqE/SkfB family radical SAM enzyme